MVDRDAPPAAADETVQPPLTSWQVGGAAAALFTLAISQPLLDLLGRYPEFFIAQGARWAHVVAYGLVLAVVLPIAVALGLVALWLLHRTSAAIVTGVVAGVLVALVVIQLLDGVGAPTLVALAGGLVAGPGLVLAASRSAGLRTLLPWGWAVPLVALGLFLLVSPVSQLRGSAEAQATEIAVGDPRPVFLFIFDEFPVSSIVTPDGVIDERIAPNLARMVAEEATWYRDAASVHQHTTESVPAILSGMMPREGALPTAEDHPQNIFALLEGSLAISAEEAVTQLCTSSACDSEGGSSAGLDVGRLAKDSLLVLAHRLTPGALDERLPPLGDAWAGFGETSPAPAESEASDDPGTRLEAFIDRLGDGPHEQLHVLHVLLPHSPWRRLPDGRIYAHDRPAPGRVEAPHKYWGDNGWLVRQAYQRHLLQVGYVDTMVGRAIERLKEVGLYDDALFVITADHGLAFSEGLPVRHAMPETAPKLAAIPLIVKYPGQSAGRVETYPVQTIDVVPTILDVLQVEGAPALDGRSLRDETPRVARQLHRQDDEPLPADQIWDRVLEEARHRAQLFGTDGPLIDRIVDHSELVGAEVSELTVEEAPAEATASVADGEAYDAVTADSDPFPGLLRARVPASVAGDAVSHVAVAVNGRVVAVAETYASAEGRADVHAVILPELVGEGPSGLELMVIRDGRRPLLRLPLRSVDGG